MNPLDGNLEARTTPVGMFHYAHAYAASALTLNKVDVHTIHSDAPIRFLFSHSIELYVKAYLLLKGLSVEELASRGLGHNLKNLTSKAVKLGLSIPNEHRTWIELANEAILDRYIKTGARTVLLPESLAAICANLHEQIGPDVYAAYGLTRKPEQFQKGA